MTEENLLTPHRSTSQMSSGLKERLKRCGRYHSSPTMGQNSQRRTHFTSPLIASAEQCGAKLTQERKKCEKQVSVSAINSSKPASVDAPSSSDDSVDAMKLYTSNSDAGHKTSLSGLVRPHRLDFSQGHTVCDKVAPCSTRNESANGEAQEQDVRRQKLQTLVNEKEDVARKLRLVQFYEQKHDLGKMEELIRKWYQVCQEGLVDLLSLMPEPRPELTELIDHLGIDHRRIGYNKEDQTFTAFTD